MRRVLLIGAACIALAAAATSAALLWYFQTPPALVDAAGTVRLTAPCCPGAPPAPHTVTLAGGSQVKLQLVDTFLDQGRPAARILVVVAPGQSRIVSAHQDEAMRVSSVDVRVLRIWLMPDPANRAVDVRLTSP